MVEPRPVARWLARAEAALDAEREQLVLWAPVALGCGIAAWFLLPAPGQWLAFAAGALALAAGATLIGGRLGRVLLAAGLLAAAGLGLAWLRADAVAAPRLEAPRLTLDLTATVLKVENREGRGQWRLHLTPADATLPPRVRVTLRSPPPPGARVGALIAVRATLRPPAGPSLPGGYDFARRAWFDGIGATGYPLGPVRVLRPAPPPSGVAAWLAASRVSLTALLKARVGGGEGAIAAALVTGDQGGISEPVAKAMRDAGLAHLLSISGLHIAVVIGGVMLVTRRLLTLSEWIALRWPVKAVAAGLAAIAGVAYTLLAGAEVPTIRSCAAALLVLAGIAAGREAITLRTVAVGAFLILLAMPEALFGPSFQLSFAAVTGLVALYGAPAAQRWLTPGEDDGLRRRAIVWLGGLIASGVIAQAMLAPVALFHFNQDGVYGVFANLIAIPLTSFVIMPLLGLTLAAEPLGLAALPAAALGAVIGFLTALAQIVADWPGAVARLPTMPLAAFALIVGGGLWLALWSTRLRLLGFTPLAVGAAMAALARPPDLIVGADGVHAAIVARDGSLAMLRPRAGNFVRDMWGGQVAGEVTDWDALPSASCTGAACLAVLHRGGRPWRILATRSRDLVPRAAFQPQCAAADIVISSRRLPAWCAPRWLKLDRAALARTGAVSVRLSARPAVRTVAQDQGAHPWAVGISPSWDRGPSS